MAAGFAVLILLTVKAYQNAPPIPDKFVDPAGAVVFTADDVVAGQQVFLKHGLMDNGTIWGHGGYLGPDFSAQSLHILALDLADRIARERLSRGYGDLTAEERAAVDGAVALVLKANRYDPTSGTLALPAGAAGSFNGQVEYWTRYFAGPERTAGSPERSEGATPADRLLRLDGLGFGRHPSRHFAFLYQQFSVRTAGRKYPYF
jgi:nitric oxide reductase subunit B